MKLEGTAVLQPGAAARPGEPASGGWGAATALIAAVLVAVLGVYYETAASIVHIWYRSETFAHGFVIVPAVLWLVWRKRAALARLAPAPQYLGLAALALLGFGWLLAELAGVLVVQQLALVAMLPVLVFTVLGWRVAWALAFPLAFLMLAVPIGEGLILPLMYFTADFTVGLLRLTGIPVYREGTFFTIPSGNWSVVEGCSGLRYLIASIVGGCLYAYLTYRSLLRRLVFIAASIVVPIVANGLRAYMIVMIAHLSDMKLALGIDHFIYGWVWFGVVILLMFWVGSYWREDEEPEASRPAGAAPATQVATGGLVPAAIAAFAVAAAWPAYAVWLERDRGAVAPVELAAPGGAGGWEPDGRELTDWRPRYGGTDASLFRVYRKGDQAVALYLGYYRHQRQGAELVTSTNVMVEQKHPVWEDVGQRARRGVVESPALDVRETLLRSRPQRLVVWDWYHFDGVDTISPYRAKLLLARNRLLGERDDAFAVIVAAPYDEHRAAAEATLREFLRDMLPAIRDTMGATEAAK
jgi:exosortase A